MNQRQARNLKKLRFVLLDQTPEAINAFNIGSVSRCAWSTGLRKNLFRSGLGWGGDPRSSSFPHLLGLVDPEEQQYLFQQFSAPRPSEYIFDLFEFEHPSHLAGIEEFADRVENVLQFYGQADA